ncbi:MAG: hypothetical protein M3Q10_19620 [Chloroflexota bacterium]|nr:hypothetical protein [Chloroflexota bacterium]
MAPERPPSHPAGSHPSTRRCVGWFVIGAIATLLLAPAGAEAHARWFTAEGPYSAPEWDRLVSLPVALALGSGLAAVVALGLLQRVLGDPLWPRPPFFQRLEPSAAAILGVQAAITMIFMASRLNLFVPNIQLPRNLLGVLIAGVTVVAAFSFITGVLTRVGALVTIGLVILAFAFAPPYEVLEQVIYVGIALYLLAVGRGVVRYEDRTEEDRSPLSDRLLPYALPLLRVCAGVSVLILGFTEKLINGNLGAAFLADRPRFNVARELGLSWFTDERFIYAVGIVEVTAGIALLSGYLTRVVILALWIPFNLGIAFLPAEELIGHLPILSTMYVLLVRGTEGIPPPVEERPRAADPVPRQRAAAVAAPVPRT